LRDVAAADKHVQRLGLQFCAMTRRAFLCCLVLSEKYTYVLLVPLLFQRAKEREYPDVATTRFGVQKHVALRRRQVEPRHIHRNAVLLREFRQRSALVVVTRLGPRLDGTIAKRSVGIRNHERLVVLENRTESIATRTCAARIVEREQLRSGSGQARAVVGTLEAIRESEPSDHLAIQRR